MFLQAFEVRKAGLSALKCWNSVTCDEENFDVKALKFASFLQQSDDLILTLFCFKTLAKTFDFVTICSFSSGKQG